MTTQKKMPPHSEHVREHLRRIEGGHVSVTDPGAVYLGHNDGDRFWEVVGMRLNGHPAPVVGAVPFRGHDFPGVQHSRESLSSLLSVSQSSRRSGPTGGPSGWIPVLLPRARQTVPNFLAGLRAGNVPKPVLIDPTTVEFAFDFRLGNPFGLKSLRKPLSRHLIRTERGHLISGYCYAPMDRGSAGSDSFFSITDAIQHTAQGSRRLLPLALRRSFVNLIVDISDDETRMAAAQWVPFLPATANSEHLLLG